jgi:hypothetical protein
MNLLLIHTDFSVHVLDYFTNLAAFTPASATQEL